MYKGIKKTSFLFLVMFTVLFTGAFSYANFSDVQGHWGEKCINKWAENGVINGFEDGTVHPNDDITRAEFVTIINKILKFNEKSKETFNDVNEKAWYAEEFAKARQAGYLIEFEGNLAKPTEKLNREQAATMLYKALQLTADKSTKVRQFTDEQSIPSYALQSIRVLSAEGVINGYPDGTFKPSNVIKRVEAIKMMDNIFKGYYNKKGTYENENIKGSAIINTSDVVLKNVKIDGNLYLAEGIGEGEVTLNNVVVTGKTFINGGGENSIYFVDTTIDELVVNKANGKVRLVSKGKSNIDSVTLKSGAKLEENNVVKTCDGFKNIIISSEVPKKQEAVFNGDFDDIVINSSNELTFDDCSIDNLEIKDTEKDKAPTLNMVKVKVEKLVCAAEGVEIEMKKGTEVESLELENETNLTVEKGAKVEKLSIDKDAKGTELDIKGSVDKVANDASDVKVNGKKMEKGEDVDIDKSKQEHHSSGGSSSDGDEPSSSVDRTAPVITGVKDNEEYQLSDKLTKVTPVSTDKDIKTVVLTKDGVKVDTYTILGDITEAGQYVLTVTDNAGNETVIRFTIKKESSNEIGFNTERKDGVDIIENKNILQFTVNGTLTNEIDTSKFKYTTSKNGEYTCTLSETYKKVDYSKDLEPGTYCYLNCLLNDEQVTEVFIGLTTEDANVIKQLEGYGNDTQASDEYDRLVADDCWYLNAKGGNKEVRNTNKIKITFENIDGVEGLYFYDKDDNYTGGKSIKYMDDNSVLVNVNTKNLVFKKGQYDFILSGEIKIIEINEEIINNGITIDGENWITTPELKSTTIDETHKIVTLTFNRTIQCGESAADLKSKVKIAVDGKTFIALGDNDNVEIKDGKLVITFENALTGATNKIKVEKNALRDENNIILVNEINTDFIQLEISLVNYLNAAFMENRNELIIYVNGKLTDSININNLMYTTPEKSNSSYTFTGNYEKIQWVMPLNEKPGNYYYVPSTVDTEIHMIMTDEDAKAIKALNGYGDKDDILVAKDGWYPNAKAGSQNIIVGTQISVKNVCENKAVSHVCTIDENNNIITSYTFNKNNNCIILRNKETKILFSTGCEIKYPRGYAIVVNIDKNIIDNGITLDDNGWKEIPTLKEIEATSVVTGQTLEKSQLSGTFEDAVEGSFEWKDNTEVVNATGKFTWIFTPNSTEYEEVRGSVEVIAENPVYHTGVLENLVDTKIGESMAISLTDKDLTQDDTSVMVKVKSTTNNTGVDVKLLRQEDGSYTGLVDVVASEEAGKINAEANDTITVTYIDENPADGDSAVIEKTVKALENMISKDITILDATFIENKNILFFNVKGELTDAIDIKKLAYKTSENAENAYSLVSNYTKVEDESSNNGEYYYKYYTEGENNKRTSVIMLLSNDDTNTIKSLEGYGNKGYTPEEYDRLVFSDDWYPNVKGNAIQVSNNKEFPLKITGDKEVKGIFSFIEENEEPLDNGYYGGDVRIDSRVKKIIFTTEYNWAIPTSGYMQVIQICQGNIDNGIVLNEDNWVEVNENTFSQLGEIPVLSGEITATSVEAGQSLVNSNISGKFVNNGCEVVEGELQWENNETVMNATGEFTWIFKPNNTDIYEEVRGSVEVTVLNKENVAPTASVVTIEGNAKVGETLTGKYTFSDADGDKEGISTFRWLANTGVDSSFEAIEGATSKTYEVVQDLKGNTIKFEVTPVAAEGTTTGTAVVSEATAEVTEILTYAVTLAGDAVEDTDYTVSGAEDLTAVKAGTTIKIEAIKAITVNEEAVEAGATKDIVINEATTITVNKVVEGE